MMSHPPLFVGILDADDLGPEGGQVPGGARAGELAAEVAHANARQCRRRALSP